MQLEGVIYKRPAIPNTPDRHNGSALGSTFAHDPTLLKTLDSQYIVYATGFNIPATISNDEKTFSKNGTALPLGMPWTLPWTTGQLCFGNVTNTSNSTYSCIWSPDVHEINGKYYMYYSASSLLSINSAIGMATSSTRRPGDWMNRGLVFNSSSRVNWNAIDPALFVDDDGRWYVIFESRYSGTFQYEMDPSTGFVKAGAQAIQLANDRQWGIEGPAFFKKGNHFHI
uniref:Endo-1,5-alpha-L-arabinanase A n=1 Tax=Acrobeloides nanus TaxID=290746 RepID=A0A914DTG4_9BILA